MLEAVSNSNELEGRYISVQFEDKAELTSHCTQLTLPTLGTGPPFMSTPNLVEDFYERIWNLGNVEAASELLSPDFSFRGSLGNEMRGVANFQSYVRSVREALAEYRCEILACVAEGTRPSQEVRASFGASRPLTRCRTGRNIDEKQIADLKNGSIRYSQMALGNMPPILEKYCPMARTATCVQIRTATANDAWLVASILRQAFAEYKPLYTSQGYSATTLGTYEIRMRINEGPVWIALHDGHIVGTASVFPKEAGFYIRGMAVLPAARGLGVGRLLLEEIEGLAVASGCKRLFLSTTPFLNRAIRLYEGFGFQRTSDGPYDLFGTPLFTMEKMVRGLTKRHPNQLLDKISGSFP